MEMAYEKILFVGALNVGEMHHASYGPEKNVED